MSFTDYHKPCQQQRVCTAESVYWREGLRWKVVLQVMYYSSPGCGQGPFFVIGRAWRKTTARAMAEEVNARLTRSEADER